jgi:ATP-dependent DNA helicase RecG
MAERQGESGPASLPVGTGEAGIRWLSAAPMLKDLLTSAELKAVRRLDALDLDEALRITPRRYVVPGPLRSLRDLVEGDEMSAPVTVVAVRDRRMRKRFGWILEIDVTDGVDHLTLTFFVYKEHQLRWYRSQLRPDSRVLVWGTVSFPTQGRGGPQITHPSFAALDEDNQDLSEIMRPTPVYPLRQGTSQKTMRSAMRKILAHADDIDQPLPDRVRRAYDLVTRTGAFHLIHAPHRAADPPRGMAHLVFEEAFVLQAIFALRRAQDTRTPAPAMRADGPLQGLLDARLPFELTGGQQEVGSRIHELLEKDHPGNVLLQGDVGSGKTVVALRAMAQAVDSGYQAVLLAPTDVLAQQHYRTIRSLLGDLGNAGQIDAHPEATAVRLLTGSRRTAERRQALLDITSGTAGIVVGTHALLTESVEFASLGLVVIDEQHRFGVDHRRRLRAKGPQGLSPHTLVMTATPIPRTAALAMVGDLDVLSLRERPRGRTEVTSFVVPEESVSWRERMWERTTEEIAAGHQAFVVCAHIDEKEPDPAGTDALAAAAPAGLPSGDHTGPGVLRGVTETARRLAAMPVLRGVRIGILHGRLPSEEKQQVMDQMVSGQIDLLVATTMVEVGVDLPEATVMVVLDAEHFGVSQLHQLRGRVGRAEHPGITFFDTRAAPDSETAQRLAKIADTHDGFALAELDLYRRGSGDLVGEEQSGLGRTLKFLDVMRDAEVIGHARTAAFQVVDEDPELENEPALRGAIDHRLRDADPNVERS